MLNKIKNKQKRVVLVISMVVVTFLSLYLLNSSHKTNNIDTLSVNYYDITGKLISSSNAQSLAAVKIPVSPNLAYYFSLTTKINNNGAETLSCQPNSVSPTEFDTVFTKTIKVVRPNNNIEWTSGLIKISDFSSMTQPVNFSLKISCTYPIPNGGTSTLNKPASIDLNFTTVCGDGYCSSNENLDKCPIDCDPSIDKVNFRTSNPLYPRTSSSAYAIAYSDTCGSSLVKYDFNLNLPGTSCFGTTVSSCPSSIGTLLLDQSKNIPGRPQWAGSNIGCLYQDNTYPDRLILAWKTTTSLYNSPCASVGNWGAIRYQKNDLSTLVSDNPIASYLNEIICN